MDLSLFRAQIINGLMKDDGDGKVVSILAYGAGGPGSNPSPSRKWYKFKLVLFRLQPIKN